MLDERGHESLGRGVGRLLHTGQAGGAGSGRGRGPEADDECGRDGAARRWSTSVKARTDEAARKTTASAATAWVTRTASGGASATVR